VFYVSCAIPAFHAFQMREFPEFPHFTHFPHYAFPDPRTWTGCWGWHRTSLAWRGVTGHHGKGSGIVMSACPRCDVCIIICTRTYIYICILGNTRITNAGIPGIPALQMREFREYPHYKCGNSGNTRIRCHIYERSIINLKIYHWVNHLYNCEYPEQFSLLWRLALYRSLTHMCMDVMVMYGCMGDTYIHIQ